MGVLYDQQSAYVQERRKWETRPTRIDPQYVAPGIDSKGHYRPAYTDGVYIEPLSIEDGGVGPYVFREFPKSVYRAEMKPGGPQIVQSKVVDDEGQERIAHGQGWFAKQEDAIQSVHDDRQELALQAANRGWHEQRMSENARAEARAVESTSAVHLGEIPRKPVKPRGRPKKVEVPS